MNQTQIKRTRREIERKLSELDRQKEDVIHEWKQLENLCKHPKLRKYSAMGEVGMVCDDCGYQT